MCPYCLIMFLGVFIASLGSFFVVMCLGASDLIGGMVVIAGFVVFLTGLALGDKNSSISSIC